jgi:NAD(P)-dependent dehydrogenase (short-subunit alcohol dehydrogenase family)
LVTGAGRGIGRTLALGLAQAGADVILTARTQEEIEAAATEITELTGRKTLTLTCDVSDPAAIESTVNKAIEEFGHIDVLINNAGVAVVKPMHELTVEEWDYVMNINLRAAFLVSKAVGPHMMNQKWGRIVNIASVASALSLKGLNAYTPSKAGVASLTTQFANEWAPFGITVNAISPWFFRTSMNCEALDVEPMLSYSTQGTPMGRTGNLEELVAPVLFFCSEGASFVNGQNLFVDGGATIMGL